MKIVANDVLQRLEIQFEIMDYEVVAVNCDALEEWEILPEPMEMPILVIISAVVIVDSEKEQVGQVEKTFEVDKTCICHHLSISACYCIDIPLIKNRKYRD